MALGVSSMLLLGVFASSQQLRHAARAADNLHQLEERARFVLDLLRADIRLAGFWGLHADRQAVRRGSGATVRCGRADATGWALRLTHPAAAADDAWNLPCPPFRNRRQPGADVLEIRRASLATSGADARSVQILSSRREAVIFSATAPPTLEGSTELRDLRVHAWYVAAGSSRSSQVPSLRRKTLIGGRLLRDEEILTDIEDLQIRLAVDSNLDGAADRVVDPAVPLSADERVVAVRFWLLLRSEAPETGYKDPRAYAYANRPPRIFDDGRRRLLVAGSEVVANAL
ncbi:MAG: PilW family protein [Gammaproteobacteria bacterium]|nr:PilW family protein [Gammaproteobacteria bacterium]